MPYCSYCGGTTRADSRYCSYCGKEIPQAGIIVLTLISGESSDRGQKRQENEDHIVSLEISHQGQTQRESLGWYMVADGLGGHDAGEQASESVARFLTEAVIKSFIIPTSRQDTLLPHESATAAAHLADAIRETNERLYTASMQYSNNMASTLVGLLITRREALIANVGDSRCYLFRNGTLRQMTKDHSLSAEQAQRPAVKGGTPFAFPRNVVSRVLGAESTVEPDIYRVALDNGDRFLLCTDGLWSLVNDTQIAAILMAEPDSQRAARALINAANRAGGSDNISAIVVDCALAVISEPTAAGPG